MKKLTIALLLLAGLASAKPAFETKKLSESGKATAKTMGYNASVSYPNCPAGAAMARTEMASFHKDLAEMGPASDPTRKASLDLSYEVLYNGPSLTTAYISGIADFAGAHPSTLQRALLISPQGAAIQPAQCFQKGWLTALRDYSRPILKKRLKDGDPDWITKGTEATADNYKVILPQAKQLKVIFTDYQVCSHAEGPQEVLIPYSALRQQINPKGPLAFALQ
ncbi:MAG: DUF3298 domain-containing protein [Candidatus Eremiobacteraeota bacterium]|nr:DUF3298 domain-containing protein [Candidatus Eremiobacteraeota bacterium]